MRKYFIAFLAVLTLTGCSLVSSGYQYPHPSPDVTNAIIVHASFDKTWNSVIDQFAISGDPIKLIDKNSGIVTSEVMTVSVDTMYADCGRYPQLILVPTDRLFTITVHEDNGQSIVRVNARWWNTTGYGLSKPTSNIFIRPEHQDATACSTKYVWEHNLEDIIKHTAEGN